MTTLRFNTNWDIYLTNGFIMPLIVIVIVWHNFKFKWFASWFSRAFIDLAQLSICWGKFAYNEVKYLI